MTERLQPPYIETSKPAGQLRARCMKLLPTTFYFNAGQEWLPIEPEIGDKIRDKFISYARLTQFTPLTPEVMIQALDQPSEVYGNNQGKGFTTFQAYLAESVARALKVSAQHEGASEGSVTHLSAADYIAMRRLLDRFGILLAEEPFTKVTESRLVEIAEWLQYLWETGIKYDYVERYLDQKQLKNLLHLFEQDLHNTWDETTVIPKSDEYFVDSDDEAEIKRLRRNDNLGFALRSLQSLDTTPPLLPRNELIMRLKFGLRGRGLSPEEMMDYCKDEIRLIENLQIVSEEVREKWIQKIQTSGISNDTNQRLSDLEIFLTTNPISRTPAFYRKLNEYKNFLEQISGFSIDEINGTIDRINGIFAKISSGSVQDVEKSDVFSNSDIFIAVFCGLSEPSDEFFAGRKPLNMSSIGTILGITGENIRQHQERSLTRLKKVLATIGQSADGTL